MMETGRKIRTIYTLKVDAGCGGPLLADSLQQLKPLASRGTYHGEVQVDAYELYWRLE